MKAKFWKILYTIVVFLFIFSCILALINAGLNALKRYDQELILYEKIVAFNQLHTILDMSERVAFESESAGKFFLASGRIEGNAESLDMIKFSWKHKSTGFIYTSTVPENKIKVKIRNSMEDPAFRIFSDYNSSKGGLIIFLRKLSGNMNLLLDSNGEMSNYLRYIEIYISEEDYLGEEVFSNL